MCNRFQASNLDRIILRGNKRPVMEIREKDIINTTGI